MVRVTTGVFTLINIFPFFLGLVAVVASVNFRINGNPDICINALRNPLLIIGFVLLLVSLLAFVGSFCNKAHAALTAYSILMVLVILAFTCFALFTLVVTNRGVARKISGVGFSEYKIDDYSDWLHKFVNHGNWDRIRTCLSDSQVCSTLTSDATFSDFIKQKMSSIQSGCCKPPLYCKFMYKNATYWVEPVTGPAEADSDCRTWSNDQAKLCYNCKSCKGGVLSNLRREWRLMAVLNIIVLVVALITFNIGCSIRKKKKPADNINYQHDFPDA